MVSASFWGVPVVPQTQCGFCWCGSTRAVCILLILIPLALAAKKQNGLFCRCIFRFGD
jgi:hypothetical protein